LSDVQHFKLKSRQKSFVGWVPPGPAMGLYSAPSSPWLD